jgi:hypothetical protein
MHIKCWWESLKRTDHFEDVDKWKDNIKINVREMGLEDVDFIHVAHDRDQWRALVNMLMNLQVP